MAKIQIKSNDKDIEHYHARRMAMDSMLCRFKADVRQHPRLGHGDWQLCLRWLYEIDRRQYPRLGNED